MDRRGTKWNSYGYTNNWNENDKIGHTITFETAWNRPEPVFIRLTELHPGLSIHLKYADEDLGHNCGEITYSGGEIVESWIPDRDSREAYEFSAEVLGVTLSEQGLYLNDSGEYEYREEDEMSME